MRKLVILLTAVFVAVLLSGTAFAAKERVEITDCVCNEQEDSTYDCTITFSGAAPLTNATDYHAHVTTEQDGVLENSDPWTCKAQTDCAGAGGTHPNYTALCTLAPLPASDCTELLEPGYFFGIVAKVAGDAEEETHGNAVRALKDNFPNCTINAYED
jgi:hypothetical protein